MTDIAISGKNLSKMYKVYARPMDMIRELITGRPQHHDCWALKDVSLSAIAFSED